jgi:hypothetical protein
MLVKARRLLFFLLSLFIFQNAFSQNTTRSPYSRYGLGEINFNGFARSYGMGQINQGLRSRTNINILNPASYGVIDSTVFETGAIMRLGKFSTADNSQDFNTANYGYLALGFPLMAKRGWGASFGLLPYSATGYINSNTADSSFSSYTQTFQGLGGLSRVFLGTGLRLFQNRDTSLIHHRLSVGTNFSYLFGQIRKSKYQRFPDNSNFNSYIEERDQYLSNVSYEAGLQYSIGFGGRGKSEKKYGMVLGLTYQPEITLNSSGRFIAATYEYSNIGVPEIIDSVILVENIKGTATLPEAMRAGIVFEKSGRWLIGADYSAQKWEGFKMPGSTDSLRNSYQLSLGGQYTPKMNELLGKARKDITLGTYLRSTSYRFGVRYGNTNLRINGTDIREMGASIGFGIPIAPTSRLNLSLDYTVRGTTENNLIKEQFFRIILGLTLNDKWFQRHKIE